MGDVMKENPDLMKQFASAALNSMNEADGITQDPRGPAQMAPPGMGPPTGYQQPEARPRPARTAAPEFPFNNSGSKAGPPRETREMSAPPGMEDLLADLAGPSTSPAEFNTPAPGGSRKSLSLNL